MDGFTTFVFLHLISFGVTIGLAIYCYLLRKGLRQQSDAVHKYVIDTQKSMNTILKAVHQLQQQYLLGSGGLTAALLSGIPGAGPGLTVTPGSPEEHAEIPPPDTEEDTGEDDGLTTLGDILNQ